MRVLMAADGSKHGTAALVSACRILVSKQRSVDLVCVAPKVRPERPGWQERLQHRAARIASRVQRTIAEAGVDATPVVKTGSAARVLLRLSQDYDVIAVGAKSHSDSASPGLGPVATRLIEHANASVLIGRDGSNESALRILVPVDGSDGSARALDQLGKLIELAGADVTLMHVVETHWLQPVDDPDWAMGDDYEHSTEPHADLEREFTSEAERLLEAARDRLPARTATHTMVCQGIPADQILSEADSGEYDLLVLAATGEMDVKHRILGSVSGKVALNAPCSVLLVHTGD